MVYFTEESRKAMGELRTEQERIKYLLTYLEDALVIAEDANEKRAMAMTYKAATDALASLQQAEQLCNSILADGYLDQTADKV
jgi:aminoglycoside phosphotransferase